ncbi:Uridine phosphorylase 1 [Eumeta japonica]|uniref:Uridine phosphorylase 1 n=1 Tax=Eumeta variegata TaxID=151549 RepID=A0A4C1W433_EUMVA|nr:Uridine phosphorylase 1 [Eumeta japonica]
MIRDSCSQHGMGIPSVGILLHEIIKLMYHAKVRDPVFFRIGTCGGIGYEGGTVIISEEAVDGAMRNVLDLVNDYIRAYIILLINQSERADDTARRKQPRAAVGDGKSIRARLDTFWHPSSITDAVDSFYGVVFRGQNGFVSSLSSYMRDKTGRSETVLGKSVQRPAKLDRRLVRELKALADPEDPYETVTGKTMCTYDFYEGQGRLDGAFCDFTETDKMEYLEKIHKLGVINIEMESLAFAALTHHAGVKAAVVCVTLLDRLKSDQVLAPKEVLDEWQQRPTTLVCRYIKRYLQMKGRISLDGHGSVAVKSPRRFKLVQQESETYD